MLKKFGLEDSKPTKTSMSTEIKLIKDDKADSIDCTKYRGMIGSLLYLTTSRPDIMFSVCLCARFQENPKTTHLEADEVFSIWKAFGGNTHDLGSFREETDKTTDLHQNLLKIMLTERGDSVASIKRHRHDLRSDGVSTLVTPSEHG
ncbi:hypothetical protein Tco_0620236 [Tanacetum coccineum]